MNTTVIDHIPRPHLPRPIHVADGDSITVVLDASDARVIQFWLRDHGAYIEPIAGTGDDTALKFGIVWPPEPGRAAS